MNGRVDTQDRTPTQGAGCLGELGWILSGFVLPLGSFTYYRKAAQKSVGQAILFFFVFTVTASCLASIGIGVTLQAVGTDIRQSFDDGTVPVIVIRDGVAEVNGPQPVILADIRDETNSRVFVAIDTTGRIKQIDTGRYDQGILLKERELHFLNQNGDYQVLPLQELNSMFETDTIVIDANTVTRGWRVFSIIVSIAAFLGLFLWNSIARLMIVALIALVMWGAVTLFRPNTGFGPIIISGVYSLVPAVYTSHLFTRAGISIPCLQTLLFLLAWMAALFISLSPIDFLAQERRPRLWRAWFGLPFLLVLAADLILTFTYGEIISWALFILTGIALAVVGILPLMRSGQASPPEPPVASS